MVFLFVEGFLLGKFVSERQYKIKQLTQPEYITVIKQIQTLRQSIERTAQNISDTTQLHTHPKYNRLMWDEAESCSSKTIERNFDETFDVFIEKLVDNELDVVFECFVKLKNIMSTIGKD